MVAGLAGLGVGEGDVVGDDDTDGDGELGTPHRAAVFLPTDWTTCTDWFWPPPVCAAVTWVRLTGWWVLLKIQRDSGTFAPCGYPFGSR
jgi:hypothetical protein